MDLQVVPDEAGMLEQRGGCWEALETRASASQGLEQPWHHHCGRSYGGFTGEAGGYRLAEATSPDARESHPRQPLGWALLGRIATCVLPVSFELT